MNQLIRKFYTQANEHGVGSTVRATEQYLSNPYRTRSEVKLKQWWSYSRHHQAELNPYRVLWVDPDDIRSVTVSTTDILKQYGLDLVLAHVIPGDWDLEQRSFEKPQYECFRQHFCNDVPWEETKLYRQVLQGETTWRNSTTEAELKQRCEYVDELYESITENGFKSVEEIQGNKPVVPDDIKIMIGRDGSLLYLDGKHRLALGKILDVKKVPVNVIIRHAEWQRLRNWVATNELKPLSNDEMLNHPDVVYLQ